MGEHTYFALLIIWNTKTYFFTYYYSLKKFSLLPRKLPLRSRHHLTINRAKISRKDRRDFSYLAFVPANIAILLWNQTESRFSRWKDDFGEETAVSRQRCADFEGMGSWMHILDKQSYLLPMPAHPSRQCLPSILSLTLCEIDVELISYRW